MRALVARGDQLKLVPAARTLCETLAVQLAVLVGLAARRSRPTGA